MGSSRIEGAEGAGRSWRGTRRWVPREGGVSRARRDWKDEQGGDAPSEEVCARKRRARTRNAG